MKKGFVLLFLLTLLVACSAVTVASPRPLQIPAAPIVTPVYSATLLVPQVVTKMVELDRFVEQGAGPIAALVFTQDSSELLSAHAREGRLRRWGIRDKQLHMSFDIEDISLSATSFDGRARLVAIAAGAAPQAMQTGYAVKVDGVSIWDVETGGQIAQVARSGPYADVELSRDGRWWAGVDGGVLFIGDTAGTRFESVGLSNFESPSAINNFDTVALDAVGEYVAIASENGGIMLIRWDGKEIGKGFHLRAYPKIVIR